MASGNPDTVIMQTQAFDVTNNHELHNAIRMEIGADGVETRIGGIGNVAGGETISSTNRAVIRYQRESLANLRRYGRRHATVQAIPKPQRPVDIPGVCPACQGTGEVWKGREDTGRLVVCPQCGGDDQ